MMEVQTDSPMSPQAALNAIRRSNGIMQVPSKGHAKKRAIARHLEAFDLDMGEDELSDVQLERLDALVALVDQLVERGDLTEHDTVLSYGTGGISREPVEEVFTVYTMLSRHNA